MNDVEFKGLKGFLLFHIKANIHDLTQAQWENLFVAIQDLFITYEPKRRRVIIPSKVNREPFPEFKNIIDETNRRLKNG